MLVGVFGYHRYICVHTKHCCLCISLCCQQIIFTKSAAEHKGNDIGFTENKHQSLPMPLLSGKFVNITALNELQPTSFFIQSLSVKKKQPQHIFFWFLFFTFVHILIKLLLFNMKTVNILVKDFKQEGELSGGEIAITELQNSVNKIKFEPSENLIPMVIKILFIFFVHVFLTIL